MEIHREDFEKNLKKPLIATKPIFTINTQECKINASNINEKYEQYIQKETHSPVLFDDEVDPDTLELHVKTGNRKDCKEYYVKIEYSMNEPTDINNPGCVNIEVYDSHMRFLDGGELDYTDENAKLKDIVFDCLEFMDIKNVYEVLQTRFLKFI